MGEIQESYLYEPGKEEGQKCDRPEEWNKQMYVNEKPYSVCVVLDWRALQLD